MKKEYPLLLAAVKKEQQSKWAIGDALLAEVGKPSEQNMNDGSYEKLTAAAAYLELHGYEDYDPRALGFIRQTAHDFPKSRRHPDLSFYAHRVAGTPDMLDAIRKGARGKKIGGPYILSVRAAQRRVEEKEREAERERTQRELERQKKAVKEAREAVIKATDKAAARAKLAEQAEKLEAAKIAARRPPPARTGIITEEVEPQAVIESGVSADLGGLVVLVKQIDRKLTTELLSSVRESALDVYREDALTAMNLLKGIVDKLAKASPNKRGHLYVATG
jgi:hypothetical protein